MSNKFGFFNERLRPLSADAAEKVLARWRIEHYVSEETRRSLLVADPDLLKVDQATPQAAPSTERQQYDRAVEASRVGGNVVSLEAYREQNRISPEVEALGQQRLADQARTSIADIEEVHRESAA